MMRNLMCIVPANYEELRTKGVDFGIQMRDLNGYWDEVFTIHPFCSANRQMRISSRHTVIEFRKWDLRIIPRLSGLIRRQGITAIKAHDPFICGLLGLTLSRLCNIPCVVFICSSYDLLARPLLRSRLADKMVNRVTMKGATLVFVGTEPAHRLALSMGAEVGKIRQVRSANVWTGYFDKLQERGNRKAIVIFVGRLSAEKYVTDAIKAFSVVAADVPEAELHVYGEGDTDIGAQVKELGLTDKVTLFGFQPQERVREALLSASALLVPLGGNVLVEACLSQTPIVAYDIDWHSELIEHNTSGMLAPFRDWHTMGELATQLLRDRELSTRLGKEARIRALSQRHPNLLCRIEAQVFDEILSERRGRDVHSTGKS